MLKKPKTADRLDREIAQTHDKFERAIDKHREDVQKRVSHVRDRMASLEEEHSLLRKLDERL